MLGAIAGDIVGSAYEFNNTRDYDFELFTGESDYTDDTIMTVAVADWLLNDREHSAQCLERTLVRYGEKYPCPKGSYGTMFSSWLRNPDRRPYGSWGNGSAMRASACGWWADTLDETLRLAEISASVTHNHPEGIKGAQATAAAIFLAGTGESKDAIREYITETFGYDLNRTWDVLHHTYDWDSSCQGTVPEAIIAFLDSTDFEDALRKAVSMGGDSDTLACITGGIAEAFYGGVPRGIAERCVGLLPQEFRVVHGDFQGKCSYGNILVESI